MEVIVAVAVPVVVLVFAGGLGLFYTRRTKRKGQNNHELLSHAIWLIRLLDYL